MIVNNTKSFGMTPVYISKLFGYFCLSKFLSYYPYIP